MTAAFRIIPLLSALFWIVCIPSQMSAQTLYQQKRAQIQSQQKETQGTIDQLDDRIRRVSDRLDQASKEFNTVNRNYKELTLLISLQQEKIKAIERTIDQTGREIELIRQNLDMLDAESERLIQEYKKTLTYLYMYGKTHTLALLFLSPSINKMLVRSVYLRKYEQFRTQQVQLIRQTQDLQRISMNDLGEANRANDSLLVLQTREQKVLREKEDRLESEIRRIRSDQNDLKKQIADFRRQQEELNSELERLSLVEDRLQEAERERQRMLELARQIENEGERAKAVETYSTPVAIRRSATAEDLAQFERDFLAARGSLPWPVQNGVVTERFGVKVHPVFKTKIQNAGVDISVPARSAVRAVNDGIVYAIQPFLGYGDVILVNHGQYKTAYGNLSDIRVSTDQIVRRGDVVGLSGTSESIRGEVVFFLIRDGTDNVDPEPWLSSRVK